MEITAQLSQPLDQVAWQPLAGYGRDRRYTLFANQQKITFTLPRDADNASGCETLRFHRQAGINAQIHYGAGHNLLGLSYSYVESMDVNLIADRNEDWTLHVPKYALSLLRSHRYGNGWTEDMSLFNVDDAANNVSVVLADLKWTKKIKAASGDLGIAMNLQDVFEEQEVMLRESGNTPCRRKLRTLSTLRYGL
jgi:hypothetical protein